METPLTPVHSQKGSHWPHSPFPSEARSTCWMAQGSAALRAAASSRRLQASRDRVYGAATSSGPCGPGAGIGGCQVGPPPPEPEPHRGRPPVGVPGCGCACALVCRVW